MDDALSLLPLGGVGEIGMNGLALGWRGRRWLIDCGVMFPDATVASTDLVLPDLTWFDREGGSLAGIVLTHAHEDHIGALPFVLERCRVPVYGARFTLELVGRRLEEHGLAGRIDLRLLETASRGGGVVRPPETPDLAFSLLRVTHSIPDAASLVVETPIGTVLHTGDFKIDEEPMDGEHFDRDGFRQLGDRGVLLMLSDSTNAQVPGRTLSERAVAGEIERRVAEWPGRVVVTQFASNLHRLRGLDEIARRTGRRLCLFGRSFRKYIAAARAAGIPSIDESRLIDPDRLGNVPHREALVVVTGSQGERRAALYKASVGDLQGLRLGKDDLIFLSSRVIPGNERPVYRIVNDLARLGATIVHSAAAPIHASGHARREELREMLSLVRPKMFVPVHGEYAFLKEHERLAIEEGVKTTLVMENGEELRVHPTEGLSRIRSTALDPHYFDGSVTADAAELGLEERNRMFYNGCVAAHILLRRQAPALAAVVDLQARGVFTNEGHHLDRAASEVADAVAEQPLNAPDGELEEIARAVIRRYFRKSVGKKPVVMAFVSSATP